MRMASKDVLQIVYDDDFGMSAAEESGFEGERITGSGVMVLMVVEENKEEDDRRSPREPETTSDHETG